MKSFAIDQIPLRRVNAQQILHEEIIALVLSVVLAHGVVGARNDDKLKLLVRLYKGIDQLISAGRIDIIIYFAKPNISGR